ncbi:MAG: heme exporter protein CcmD [Pseudomonadota bacterium]|nr:heme exporter protein CcmD [Gammaproteobacteria bacterium]MBU1732693.1 heme exporter protein CcmD [Gammaproteobacteria bacterium]MBU1891518.1 heme exporter protein CcmD [Gammaproteobacteria bacterium]
MNWNSWSEFFHMGGYGLYVWGSYAVTFALIVGEVLLLRVRRKQALKMALRTVKYGKVENNEIAT